jgi:hypothetical protein
MFSVSLVSSAAKKIIVLAGGRVVSSSTPEALPDGAIEILNQSGTGDMGQNTANDAIPTNQVAEATEPTMDPNAKKSGKLVAEEGRASGRVPKKLVWQYLKYYGPPVVIFGLILLGVVDQLIWYVFIRCRSAKGYGRLTRCEGWGIHFLLAFGLVSSYAISVAMRSLSLTAHRSVLGAG